jgi:hypothetical protein
MFAALRYQPLEKIVEIQRYVRVGVFLDNQRTGSMLHKQRQDTVRNPLFLKPFLRGIGEGIQSFAARRNSKSGVACHTSNSYIL